MAGKKKDPIVSVVTYTPGKTMKVRITGATRFAGEHRDEGTVLEVHEGDGHELIIAGKAEKHEAPESGETAEGAE